MKHTEQRGRLQAGEITNACLGSAAKHIQANLCFPVSSSNIQVAPIY